MSPGERGYEIAYKEALRAISDQQSAVDSIQSRVGLTASAGVIVLSLTAQRSFESTARASALEIAIVAFLFLALLTAYILWPRRKWRFHFGADRLHSEYVEHAQPLSSALMMRDLAIHLDRYFQSNSRYIDRMSWAFAGSLALLIVEATAFAYDVFGGL